MGLTPKRHADVAATLQEIEQYLAALAMEIAGAKPATTQSTAIQQATIRAIGGVAQLRQLIADAQEKPRSGETMRRRRDIPPA